MDFKRAQDAFAAGNVDRVCAELAALYPHDPEVTRLPEFVKFSLFGGSVPVSFIPSSQVLIESIAGTINANNERLKYPSRHYLSSDLDFIADMDGVGGWTAIQALNRLTLDHIKPTRHCAVVGTMRDDGIYIMEWVAHHFALGFEHIFLYTNDNSDASDILLAQLAEKRLITLIESEITGAVPPEAKAFGHALHLLKELREFEWVLFVDSDEFLVLGPQYANSIHRALNVLDQKDPDKRIAGICYNWLWFISDMVFERKSGLLAERFQHARTHWLSKCLVRIRDVQSMRQQHHPEVAPGHLVVDSEFKPLDIQKIWERHEAQYEGGRINHYWPRSFQEFAVKKARGATLGDDNNMYDRPYEQFFLWNGYSTAENAYPTDANLLTLVKAQLSKLRAEPAIAEAADKIDRDFTEFLKMKVSDRQLRVDYERNAKEPGDL